MKHIIQNCKILILILLLNSCSDKDEISPIVGHWKIVNYEIRTTNPSTSWRSLGEACRFDDVEEFKANGKWISYDGTHQCPGGNGTGIYRGTWKLTANDTKVIFTYEGVPGEYESTIESLTNTTLVLSFATGSIDGRQNRITYTRN